jgi:rhomboid protease GluP
LGYVRALGETGRLTDMLYAAAGQRLPGHPMMSVYRALCRLPPFAFAGQVDRAAELLDGPLSRLPAGTRAVWLATAELSAGETDAATARLAAAGPAAKPGTRAAMVHRLAQPPAVAVLSPVDVLMLDQLHRDARHEATYAGGGGPVPWVTYALITANVAMFAVECALGGWADDSDRYDQMLRQLGALSRGTLDAGQYWRLLTANFLHFGSAHIALNMLALLALGPAVERALGRLPFAALYLLSGVLAVWTAAARMADPGEILLGASGAIMGIIGATAAVQARGWLRERAAVAARRLRMVVVIVLLQAAFDYFTPQVSGTAHLAGAAYGFVLASLLPHGRGKRRAIAASVPAAA